MPFDLGFFIGRFQPFHKGHLHVVQFTLMHCQKMLICVGYNKKPPCSKNPFTAQDRIELIQNHMNVYLGQDASRVIIQPLEDFQTDEKWTQAVKLKVLSMAEPNDTITMAGHQKDESTYYLNLFPEWGYLEIPNYRGINATEIRKAWLTHSLFDNPKLIEQITPETQAFLRRHRKPIKP